MPCTRNKAVETKDSISSKQPVKVDDNENDNLSLEEHAKSKHVTELSKELVGNKHVTELSKERVGNEHVTELSKERAKQTNNIKTQNRTNCCKSADVASINSANSVGDNDNNSLKVGDSSKKKTTEPEQPVTIQAESQTKGHAQNKAVVIHVQGNNTNKPTSSRKSRSEDTVKYQNELYGKTKAGESKENTPKHKKQKKKGLNTEEDIQAVYKNQIASLNTTAQGASVMGMATLDSQPTVEEENSLLENAEEERKRNKQRVRAKKIKENIHMSPAKVMTKLDVAYENAQREIDKVLQPQDEETDMERKKDQRKKKKRKKKDMDEMKGEVNEACSSDEKESLETARQKMHKLLDDAFSMISQRKSSVTNKVEPSRQNSFDKDSPTGKDRHLTRAEQMVQTDLNMDYEKQHTPLHIYSHGLREKAGLTPWSPYRAYDDTTLISLSNPETNLNTAPVHQEKFTTAIFEQQYRPHSNFYTTEPGEPIVIKTKNMEQNMPQHERHRTTGKHSRQNNSYAQPISTITIQNSDSSLPDHSTTEYPNSYYDLSSFQEIPMTSIPPRLRESKTNNGFDRFETGTNDIYMHQDERSIPRHKGNKNDDVIDVIKDSLQPGKSPQPLINSLRNELQTLSTRRNTNKKALENADEETIQIKEFRKADRRDEPFGVKSFPVTGSSDV